MNETQIKAYEKKANELLPLLPKGLIFPEGCDGAIERCIIYMRTNLYSYEEIQKKLGSLPKKTIREVLKKYAPELISVDTNNHKIPDDLHKDYDWTWEDFKNNKILK